MNIEKCIYNIKQRRTQETTKNGKHVYMINGDYYKLYTDGKKIYLERDEKEIELSAMMIKKICETAR